MRILNCWLPIYTLLVFSSAYLAQASDVIFYGEPSVGIGYNSLNVSLGGAIADLNNKGSGLIVGGLLGWRADYVHLQILGGAEQMFLNTSGSGGLLHFGGGLGWEWNLPLMTNIFFKSFSPYGDNISTESSSFFGLGVGLSYFISEKIKLNFDYIGFDTELEGFGFKGDLFSITMSFPTNFNYPKEWWRVRQAPGSESL